MEIEKKTDKKLTTTYSFTLNAALVTHCRLLEFGLPEVFSGAGDVSFSDVFFGKEISYYSLLATKGLDFLILDMDSQPRAFMMQLTRLAIKEIKLPVVIITSTYSLHECSYFTSAGATAYLGKHMDASYYHSALHDIIKEINKNRPTPPFPELLKKKTDLLEKFNGLTPCEKSVAKFILEGLSVKDISLIKNRSIKTISGQKQSAMRKLGINNLIEMSRALDHLFLTHR